MRKKGLKWWGIVWLRIAVGVVLSLLIARTRGLSLQHPFALNARYLSDGFFVVGMVMTGIGTLMWVSTTGFFDMMSYGVRSLLVLFSPLKKPSEHQSFYDYKVARDEKRGKVRYGLLLTGIGHILMSLLLLGIYYS